MRGDVLKPRHAMNYVAGEVEAIDFVQDGHVERRRRGALLLVAADMQVVVVLPPVGQAVYQIWIAVEREDDGLVDGEDGIEVAVREAVRMLARGLQRHE